MSESATVPAKFLYRVVDQRAGDLAQELPLLSVSISRGVTRRDEIIDTKPRADDLRTYKVCSRLDLVINRMSAYQGALGISPIKGLVSPDYLVLRANSSVDPRFLAYTFHSARFIGEMTARLRGIGSTEQGNVRTPRINENDLGRIAVYVPARVKQSAVAGYLDRETRRMDALISAKRRMIALLEERRTHLLLKHVAPHLVPRGGVPHDWAATRLKHLFYRPVSGVWGSEARGDTLDTLCIRVADFDRKKFRVDERAATFRCVEHTIREKCQLRRGDVLIEKSGGGDVHPVGFAVIFDLQVDAISSNFVARLRPRPGLVPAYAGLVLASAYRAKCNLPFVKQTTGIQNLDLSAYLSLSWPIPNRAAQIAIYEHLDSLFSTIDRVGELVDRQVGLLQRRRQALITAAVTGQLDIAGTA